MMDIAKDIKARTGGKLHAVVATHRHRDHISGFATDKAGKATGDVIKSLEPDLVVQPWTEDPKLVPEATGPSGSNANNKKFGAGTSKQVAALSLMHEVARQSMAASNLPKGLRPEIIQILTLQADALKKRLGIVAPKRIDPKRKRCFASFGKIATRSRSTRTAISKSSRFEIDQHVPFRFSAVLKAQEKAVTESD